MDEAAFITATRFSRQKVVTVCSDRIDFKVPIPAGTIIEWIGNVSPAGNTSLKIKVDIFIEQMSADERQKAISREFSFVALTTRRGLSNLSALTHQRTPICTVHKADTQKLTLQKSLPCSHTSGTHPTFVDTCVPLTHPNEGGRTTWVGHYTG